MPKPEAVKRWSAYEKRKINEIYEFSSQYKSVFNQLE